MELPLRRKIPSVDVDDIGEGLKGVEGNARRQEEPPAVLEDAENAQRDQEDGGEEEGACFHFPGEAVHEEACRIGHHCHGKQNDTRPRTLHHEKGPAGDEQEQDPGPAPKARIEESGHRVEGEEENGGEIHDLSSFSSAAVRSRMIRSVRIRTPSVERWLSVP